MMKLYIAGQITGDPDYAEKFEQARVLLKGQGFTVIVPSILPEGMGPADYMRICFAMMDSADVVAFLPDYRDSRGAMLEWTWCQYVGKQTMYLADMDLCGEGLRRVAEVDQLERGMPCSLCRFGPPSSCDGKPCCICPADPIPLEPRP